MADATQMIFTVGIPTLAVLVGILVSNSRLNSSLSAVGKRIDDFRAHVDSRFSATDALFTERIRRFEEVMDARLKHLEES